jgi:hypothetical protein
MRKAIGLGGTLTVLEDGQISSIVKESLAMLFERTIPNQTLFSSSQSYWA